MPEPLLTVSDLCRRWNCRPCFIYRLVHERRIPYLKLGHRQLRFRADLLEQWLAEREFEPDGRGGDVGA